MMYLRLGACVIIRRGDVARKSAGGVADRGGHVWPRCTTAESSNATVRQC